MDRKKVFIIDDEVDFGLLMKSFFLRKNYQVWLSHTIDEALQAIKEEMPHIIFLDSNVCQIGKASIKELRKAAPDAQLIIDGWDYNTCKRLSLKQIG